MSEHDSEDKAKVDAAPANEVEQAIQNGSASESAPKGKDKGPLSKAIDAILWVAVVGVLFMAVMPRDSGPDIGPAESIAALPLVGNDSGELVALPGKLERPLLIEAFASWCGACRRQSPLMADMAEAQKEGKLDVLAISVDKSAAQALKAKNTWPIVVDVAHDARGEFSRKYKVDVLPTFILIGTDGQVKRVTAGTAGASDIRAWLTEGS